ncbi:hypothetical protein SMALB_2222 [Streptomyces malaysiensis]|uniref:Uncharacterized protein n=1 Tax=Streptomyces malaysiensis TaxID=92644 RepID=A0A7X5X0R0_STRMQ|nr:hypothetical protein [Streptomyces malaysiensis]
MRAEVRLRHLWNYQEFVTWVTEMLHDAGGDTLVGCQASLRRVDSRNELTLPATDSYSRPCRLTRVDPLAVEWTQADAPRAAAPAGCRGQSLHMHPPIGLHADPAAGAGRAACRPDCVCHWQCPVQPRQPQAVGPGRRPSARFRNDPVPLPRCRRTGEDHGTESLVSIT